MNKTPSLSSLSVEMIESLEDNLISATLSADFGTIVADVTLDVEPNYFDNGDAEFFVDSVNVQLVEDDNGEPMPLTYDAKELQDRIDILLHGVLDRSFTSQDERELIKSIS